MSRKRKNQNETSPSKKSRVESNQVENFVELGDDQIEIGLGATHGFTYFVNAAKYYTQAIELDKNNGELYYKRANARHMAARSHRSGGLARFIPSFKEAIDDYTIAINLNPAYGKAYSGRAGSKYRLKDKKGADKDFDKAIEVEPGNADLYFDKGQFKEQLSLTNEAIRNYKQCLKINPNHKEAKSALINLGVWEDSQEQASQDDKYEELVLEGISWQDNDNHRKATKSFEKAIKLNKNDTTAHALKGDAHYLCKKYDKARKAYNTAIKLNGNIAHNHYRLGLTYYQLAKQNQAENYLQDALASFNHAINIKQTEERAHTYCTYEPHLAYYSRGLVHIKLGNYHAAVDDFQAVLRDDANHLKAQEKLKVAQQLEKAKQEQQNQTAIEPVAPANHTSQDPHLIFGSTSNHVETSTSLQFSPLTINFSGEPDFIVDGINLGPISLTQNSFNSQDEIRLSQIEKLPDSYPELNSPLTTDNLGMISGSTYQNMTDLLNQSFFNGQPVFQGLGTQGNPMLNQLPVSGERHQAPATDTTPSAPASITSASQEKTAPPNKDEQNGPPNSAGSSKLRKFKRKISPGSISGSKKGYVPFAGKPKPKHKIFVDKTKDKQKAEKNSTWDEDSKVDIGKWGEEHAYITLLTPGAEYLAERYPNYDLLNEYIQPIKQKVLIKERNEQGETVYRQEEKIVKQQVRTFVDKMDASRSIDVIWNNQLEESGMSYDFKIIEYKNDKIQRKHTIEVKSTTDDESREFKVSSNECRKIFKYHRNELRSYSIFRVYNVNSEDENKKPNIKLIEEPAQKIIDGELEVKAMSIKPQ